MPGFTRSLVLALLFAVTTAYPQRNPVPGLDRYIENAIRDWQVPGCAIAIVKGDSVIYERGYGVRTLGSSEPVDQNTIFAIASTTKAMTAACLGMLVDEGKITWDDRVTDRLPGFSLFDPYVTRELTIRDLLTHRSGLERGDMLWYGSGFDRAEVLKRVRLLKPGWGFRARYGYQNIMYLAAGEIVGAASGSTWDQFIATRLFGPLGMTATSTSVTALKARTNVATPHEDVHGIVTAVRWPNFDNIGGAGAVNSSAHDMAQWVRLNLNKGVYRGTRLLKEKTIEEQCTPQMVNRLDSLTKAMRPSTHFLSYGFGWGLSDYQGRKLITHDGWLDGFRTRVAMVPEIGVGVVILLNGPRAQLHSALMLRILDHFLGAPQRDWSAEYLALFKEDQAKAKEREKERERKRIPNTTPAMPLASYAGTYVHEMYGDLTITLEKDHLTASWGSMYVGDLLHRHYETFQVNWRDISLGSDDLTFVQDVNGAVTSVKWDGSGEFTRK